MGTELHAEKFDQIVDSKWWHSDPVCCISDREVERRLTTATRKGGTIATTIWETKATDRIEAAITLARIARVSGSDMSSGIGDIYVGQLLLEAHLMGEEQAIDIISGDGINPSSD
jgi:hypothetical protein